MPHNTYTLLDSGGFRKLEQVGPYRIVRPAPQAAWRPALHDKEWNKIDATFTRFSGGTGSWEVHTKNMPEEWEVSVPAGSMILKRSSFGHIGMFAEQVPYWKKLQKIVVQASQLHDDIRVLNLFAYTGGSTLACARGGASVVHVDASKPTVAWARQNAEASGLANTPIRWIVDDVQKFVAREVRRGSTYHGIILDPPSYGRGSQGQSWKIEDDLPALLDSLMEILHKDFCFIHLSGHSENFTPLVLQHLLEERIDVQSGSFFTEEMTIDAQNGFVLPSGGSTLFIRSGLCS